MADDNEWSQPAAPPAPMFLGEKERDFVKQINDEIIERVIGQTILYYPIDVERTNYHSLYGEAINKSFLPPVRVFALVLWEGQETGWIDGNNIDKVANVTVNFHKRRITEDQNLFVREGDYVLWNDIHFEIVTLAEPRLLWGQAGTNFEISAKCIKSRKGNFDAS
jgi:hypothetical protein